MLFNSWIFAGFVAVVLPIYYLLPHRAQNFFLLIASYIFYGWWDYRFLSLLFISTIVDYTVGILLDTAESSRRRHALIIVSIVVNMGMIGFFKYFNFFVDSAAQALHALGFQPHLPVLQILLPAGISFYSFQTLSYALDVYRREEKPCRDFIGFALFVTYFPHLVAGPIQKARVLLAQIEKPRRVTQMHWDTGLQLILWGYVKKVAVADSLSPYVESAFKDPSNCDALTLLLCLYAFAIQIYCDFSGYTDIARGISRLMGIELTINFKQPYFARNITEFWRRWHISLSTWLRDYLYIPLGGNRHGARAQYRNLFITMLLGGLWHGANWTFVIWGGLHGVYLAVHKWMTGDKPIAIEPVPVGARAWLRYALSAFVTFNLVCLTWIFFRAANLDAALDYIQYMISNSLEVGASLQTQPFLGLVEAMLFYGAIIFALDFACWSRNSELPLTERHHWSVRGAAYAAGMIVLLLIREDTSGAFIYFQF